MTDDQIRAAMALPGWRWMRGMVNQRDSIVVASDDADGPWLWLEDNEHLHEGRDCPWPDYSVVDSDDPATAGCLLALLGGEAWRVQMKSDGCWHALVDPAMMSWPERPHMNSVCIRDSLGAACIAVALSLGKWPGA